MYFLVNLSPPKLLDITTINFAGAYVTLCKGYWAMFCVTQSSRSKIKKPVYALRSIDCSLVFVILFFREFSKQS